MRQLIQRGWQRPGWINYLLLPLSWLYRLVMSLRSVAYRQGLLRSHRLPVPVIVVGNITVGGTGKTPLVIELAKQLQAAGRTPGLITRGYGGTSGFWPREVSAEDSADEVGDEALMLKRQTGVPVVAGPERVRSAHLLTEKYDCDVIVSDDGFQHLALQRDLDIVVVDGERRLGNGWCLPAGPLREPPGALNRAGLVIVNGSGRAGEHVMHTGLHDAVRLDGEASRALSSWSGKKVLAMAGLGNPDRFIAALEAYGIEVEPHLFPDHHRYTRADLDFSDRDRDIDILMTDKDAVKCADLVGGERYWRVPLSVTLDTATVDLILARL